MYTSILIFAGARQTELRQTNIMKAILCTLLVATTGIVLVSSCAFALTAEPNSDRKTAPPETYTLKSVAVSYSGIGVDYAKAIARTVQAARDICVTDYGFSMPETIFINVNIDPSRKSHLFNDGADTFSLTIRDKRDLLRPAVSGIFHVYGLCHETAHLAMYRRIADRRWLTSAAAEGWAHYLGSHLVDRVYAQEGASLWPDIYDYIVDGTRRMKGQFNKESGSDIVLGSRLWSDLSEILGAQELNFLFERWGKISDEKPVEVSLKTALIQERANSRLSNWWERAAPVLFEKLETSRVVAAKTDLLQLASQPMELSHDDNQPAGKRSIAGGGHGVRFEAPEGSWFLTAVRIHGSRYGTPEPPAEDFRVWLCDEEFKAIKELRFPYARFTRGEGQWVELSVEPVSVPKKCHICVGFDPTARKGVYVSHDAAGTGNSVTGLPGKTPRPFATGDWMIRIKLDKKK